MLQWLRLIYVRCGITSMMVLSQKRRIVQQICCWCAWYPSKRKIALLSRLNSLKIVCILFQKEPINSIVIYVISSHYKNENFFLSNLKGVNSDRCQEEFHQSKCKRASLHSTIVNRLFFRKFESALMMSVLQIQTTEDS